MKRRYLGFAAGIFVLLTALFVSTDKAGAFELKNWEYEVYTNPIEPDKIATRDIRGIAVTTNTEVGVDKEDIILLVSDTSFQFSEEYRVEEINYTIGLWVEPLKHEKHSVRCGVMKSGAISVGSNMNVSNTFFDGNKVGCSYGTFF